MSHWSTDDTPEPSNTAWQDDAVSAWRNYENSNATEVANVLTGGVRTEDSEGDLFEMFLHGNGLTPETANPAELYEAAVQTDDWFARAEEVWSNENSQKIEAESLAQSTALSNTLDAFVDEHAGGDVEAATPYIDLAFEAMEAGASFDEAMAQATASLGRWNGEVDTAKRETRFEGLGLAEGMSAAFRERRAHADAPKQAVQKAVSTGQGNQGLGNTRASSDELGNAIGRMAASVRNKAYLKTMAREHARYGD